MIKVLERYIAKTTLMATALVSLIVSSVLFMITLLSELKNIGEGDYGMGRAICYVFLRLPTEIYQFSPMLLLLGSIVGLSALSSHRELAVMRVSGFSTRRIILSVLFSALLLVLAISSAGEWFAPHLSYKAEMYKENAKNGGQAVVTASGIWFRVDNNFIHVQNVVGRQLLEGVTRYQFDEKRRLQSASFAKELSYRDDKWVMDDVVQTTFYNERTKTRHFDQANWNLKFNPNLLNIGLVEPKEMSLSKLAKFSRYLKQNGLQASEYQFEFWQRIFKPFVSITMIFLAIPFVLATLGTATLGWRIVVGIIIGVAFFISNAFLGQLCIVYQVPAILAACLPLAVFIALGFILTNTMVRR